MLKPAIPGAKISNVQTLDNCPLGFHHRFHSILVLGGTDSGGFRDDGNRAIVGGDPSTYRQQRYQLGWEGDCRLLGI